MGLLKQGREAAYRRWMVEQIREWGVYEGLLAALGCEMSLTEY